MAEVESEQEKTNAISGSMATLIEEKQQAPVSFFLYAWVAWYTGEGGGWGCGMLYGNNIMESVTSLCPSVCWLVGLVCRSDIIS